MQLPRCANIYCSLKGVAGMDMDREGGACMYASSILEQTGWIGIDGARGVIEQSRTAYR